MTGGQNVVPQTRAEKKKNAIPIKVGFLYIFLLGGFTAHLEKICSSKMGSSSPDRGTPLKFDIVPKNRQSQKETHLPNIIFQGLMSNFVATTKKL